MAPQIPSALERALEVIDAAISPGSIVLGHSMGAVLAMRQAVTRPRPLRAVVLTGCFFPPARNGRTLAASVADYATHRVAFLRASRVQRSRRAGIGSIKPLASLVRQALIPAEFERALADVTASVLIVHARDDHHVPADFAVAAARRHPGWMLEVLDHGGHHAHVTQLEQWVTLVSAWLRSVV